MTTHRAIPEGYLTVGQLAAKMRTTVRTLQHYDRIGLLVPAAESVGGRRLYDAADVVRLNQILALKHLGFSLDDIRDRLVDLQTPAAVADILAQQADAIREQLVTLSKALSDIQALREQTLRMDTVDFARYADIVTLLKERNDNLWVMRVVGDRMRERIIELDGASQNDIYEAVIAAAAAAAALHARGVEPGSDEGQDVAGAMWRAILAFTGGDAALIPEMHELERRSNEWEGEFREKYSSAARQFLDAALSIWVERNGNPFGTPDQP